jgi:hypothetical protein
MQDKNTLFHQNTSFELLDFPKKVFPSDSPGMSSVFWQKHRSLKSHFAARIPFIHP